MDNQIIGLQNKNTIMGMFAGIEKSLNSLLHSSDKYMGTNLLVKVQHEDDFTVIPVNVFKQGKKSHEIETGIMTFCEHLETANGNCLKCGEWQDC